ncbi:hypothetical protein [Yoonia sp. 208BN28-4]|uniref:hypothetical protein n=1 Tax=Yoonia sp. 208BN28-4 TaxID=3126505 RepID=UPI0030B681B2
MISLHTAMKPVVAISFVALAACQATTEDELEKFVKDASRVSDAQAVLERINGDEFGGPAGLANLSAGQVPTSGSVEYNGVGSLSFYVNDNGFTDFTDGNAADFYGDAQVNVTFGATPAQTNITGSVSDLFATRTTSTSLLDVGEANGSLTITSGSVGTSGASSLTANYTYDVTGFDRNLTGGGTATGNVLADGGDTALRLNQDDVPVASTTPNLFLDLDIVGAD